MREKEIEKYLVDKIKSVGGKAFKWVSPGNAGVPDRIVFLPEGKIFFIELKAPGNTPTALQSAKHRELKKLGHTVLVIDNKIQVDRFIETEV
ncbi:MAG: VRR-NUC domain-containing protein [Anaerotignaceae bacterium]